MADKCCASDWLSGFGSLIAGAAAFIAVLAVKEPAANYLSKMSQAQSQTQMMVVNTCQAMKQADELIKLSGNPENFRKYFQTIPAEIPKGSTMPLGLIIAPEYRDATTSQLEKADSHELKQQILIHYWEKSLSKETKSNVDLRFNKNP